MNDKKIISRILRLDKEIYNELLVQDGAFQKSIAIFVSTTILVTMSGFRFLFRKDPIPKDLLMINFFASTPCLLVVPALFVSSIFLQGFIILIASIYSIVSFGSGLKQVYMLRNIEVILLIVSLTFGTSILGGT